MANIIFPDMARFSMWIMAVAGRSCPLPVADGPVELLGAWDANGDPVAGDDKISDSVVIEASNGQDLLGNAAGKWSDNNTFSNWSATSRNGYVSLEPLQPDHRFVCAVYRVSAFTAAEIGAFYRLLSERIERFAVEVPADTRSPDESRYYAELVSLAHRCMPGKALTCDRYELVVLHTLAHEHPALQARLDQML